MTKLLLSAALLVALAAGCAKNASEPTMDFGPNGGYTMRTATNLPGAQADPTDWTHDASWTTPEQNYFKDLGLDLTGSTAQVSSWYSSLYPNALSGSGGANFLLLSTAGTQGPALPATVRVQLVIVDAKYKVLETASSLVGTSVNFHFHFAADKYPPANLYRLYYVVYEPTQKTVYYRGHGDLKVEQ